MKPRRAILGDDGPSAPDKWDPIWQDPDPVHLFVAINGGTFEQIEHCYERILGLRGANAARSATGGRAPRTQRADAALPRCVRRLHQRRSDAARALWLRDGISNPFFKGSLADSSNVVGGGKRNGADGWEPLETGEFLLGYPDEACEYPVAPVPNLLGDNGTYLVYRKLHENVGTFESYLNEASAAFPGGRELLAAKLAGRWRNGAPLVHYPTEASANQFAEQWLWPKNRSPAR